MEKIKLQNNISFDIITNGVTSSKDMLSIQLISDNYSLTELEQIFKEAVNTERIELIATETNEILNIYNEFIKLDSISKKTDSILGYTDVSEQIKGALVTVIMKKVDRVDKLKSDVDYLALMSDVELE